MSAPATEQMHPLEQALAAAQGESIETNLTRWWRFAGAPAWIELQALKIRGDRPTFTASRYAHVDSPQNAARLATIADKWKAPGVYLIANRIDDSITTRDEVGAWIEMAKGRSTSDGEIAARSVLFIDIDAVRAPEISATAAEMAHASRVALAVYGELAAILEDASSLGFGHSGNGRSLLIALDHLDVTRAGALHHALLIALDAKYTDAHAKIDRAVHDAKRLIPCWGTGKRKGRAGVDERPHRKTAFTCADEVRRLTLAELEQLGATVREGLDVEVQREIDRALGVKPAPAPSKYSSDDPFARAKLTPIVDVLEALGLFEDDAPVCCGCGLRDSGVAIVGNGLKCSHDRCQAKGHAAGFRTTIDVVAEAKALTPIEAVRWLGERFGFGIPEKRHSSTNAAPDLDAETRARFDEEDAIAAPSKPVAKSDTDAEPSRGPFTPAEVLDRMRELGPAVHVATGISALDELTGGGPCLGDLVIALGAPDAAKTMLQAQLEDEMSTRGLVVGMLCADEDEDQIVTRIAQRRGWKRAEVEQRVGFDDLRPKLPSMFLYGEDWALESAFADFAARAGDRPSAFFVDSAQTVMLGEPSALKGERERVAEVVRFLRAGARRHHVLVVLSSEMTRSGYSGTERTETMAAAKWSSNFEYFAKVLIGLRSVEGEGEIVAVDVAKNKRGKRGKFHLSIDRASQKLTVTNAPAEAKKEDRRVVAKAKVVADAVLLVKLLRSTGPLKSKELRDKMRAKHGTFSSDRIGAALELCKGGIVAQDGKQGAQLHTLDLPGLPVRVLAALGSGVLGQLPPETQAKVKAVLSAGQTPDDEGGDHD